MKYDYFCQLMVATLISNSNYSMELSRSSEVSPDLVIEALNSAIDRKKPWYTGICFWQEDVHQKAAKDSIEKYLQQLPQKKVVHSPENNLDDFDGKKDITIDISSTKFDPKTTKRHRARKNTTDLEKLFNAADRLKKKREDDLKKLTPTSKFTLLAGIIGLGFSAFQTVAISISIANGEHKNDPWYAVANLGSDAGVCFWGLYAVWSGITNQDARTELAKAEALQNMLLLAHVKDLLNSQKKKRRNEAI
jgi:hypothetical protein